MAPNRTKYPLPSTPVLDWCSFAPARQAARVHSIDDISEAVITTSGRAAIYQALLQLRLAPGSIVLAPTYHCPTMIAPVILANLDVEFFGLRPDGLPNLSSIDSSTASKAKAIIVSHYFGLARSLAEVRNWCDEHRIALIEDCAHCYFGDAGERPVGTWGDFSTASLSKFFPVPEGGVLASARAHISALNLAPQDFKSQLKAWADILETSIVHGRFAGINGVLALLFKLKKLTRRAEGDAGNTEARSDAASMMQICDMARIAQTPAGAAVMLKTVLPRGQIIAKRRRNSAIFARHFEHARGAQPLFPKEDEKAVPYVFPLWVEEPDRVYHALRAQNLRVFRWDNVWPGIPQIPGDVGPSWSRHVLQFLCHQDLSESDITHTALTTLNLVSSAEPPTGTLAQ